MRWPASSSARRPTGAPRASLLDRWLSAASADLIATRRSVSDELLVAAAELLRAPDGRTFVFGQRKSAALAEYAFFLLNPLIPHVLTIEEGAGTVADALIDVGPADRLLAITFRPYARLTADVVDWFARAGGAVVLVCDDPLIPPADARAAHARVRAGEPRPVRVGRGRACSSWRRSPPTSRRARPEAPSAAWTPPRSSGPASAPTSPTIGENASRASRLARPARRISSSTSSGSSPLSGETPRASSSPAISAA